MLKNKHLFNQGNFEKSNQKQNEIKLNNSNNPNDNVGKKILNFFLPVDTAQASKEEVSTAIQMICK